MDDIDDLVTPRVSLLDAADFETKRPPSVLTKIPLTEYSKHGMIEGSKFSGVELDEVLQMDE